MVKNHVFLDLSAALTARNTCVSAHSVAFGPGARIILGLLYLHRKEASEGDQGFAARASNSKPRIPNPKP